MKQIAKDFGPEVEREVDRLVLAGSSSAAMDILSAGLKDARRSEEIPGATLANHEAALGIEITRDVMQLVFFGNADGRNEVEALLVSGNVMEAIRITHTEIASLSSRGDITLK